MIERNIKDNKTSVPFEHYKDRYRRLDPVEAGARSGIHYDNEAQEFRLHFLGREVGVSFPELSARYIASGESLAAPETILLARLILDGQVTEPTGKFLAYREMPWGNLYAENFHGRCIARLAYGFGRDLDRFRHAAAALGGIPVKMGDVSYDIEFLQGFTIRIIFWECDDEFEPSVQILFSDNFQSAFTAEDMAVVGDLTINALKGIE